MESLMENVVIVMFEELNAGLKGAYVGKDEHAWANDVHDIIPAK